MATVLIIESLLFICISQTGVYIRYLPVFVVTFVGLFWRLERLCKTKGRQNKFRFQFQCFGRSYASPKIVSLLLSERDALLYIFMPFKSSLDYTSLAVNEKEMLMGPIAKDPSPPITLRGTTVSRVQVFKLLGSMCPAT